MENAIIFNIQRFSLGDGPGIRTTVFMKGCPLNCLWCHNPESKNAYPELMLYPNKCIGCGNCLKTCPQGLHTIGEQGEHLIARDKCAHCFACADGCVGALEATGKEMTVEEILREVLKDKPFYENSGGGMTLSGGEPLLHHDFSRSLLKAAKEQGLHTCIETCGYAPWEHIEALIPYVDIFLWDIKEIDPARHREYTGVSNERILENLRRLNAAGAQIVLRCPIIPGLNDREEHLLGIAALAEELSGVTRVDVEPYHPLGQGKSEALDRDYPLSRLSFPENEQVQGWIDTIAAGTSKTVKKA